MQFLTPFIPKQNIEFRFLYIIKLFNEKESFYKIGVTSRQNVQERFEQIPYKSEIIKIYKSYSSLIFNLETHLLSLVEKYQPIKPFGGQTETTLNVTPALEFIQNIKWMKCLEDFTDLINIPPNLLALRRSMSAFEAIEYGIEPSVRTAIMYYEDPNTDNSNLYKAFPLFKEWIDAGITTANMRSNNLCRETIQSKYNQARTLLSNESTVKNILTLKVGEVYTRDELLAMVLELYSDLGMEVKKPKATDIKKWYEIKANNKLVGGKVKSAYKILKAL